MKALTIWQPWASLTVVGARPINWRKWPAPPALVDQRVVIHAGCRPVDLQEVEWLLYAARREQAQRDAGQPVSLQTGLQLRPAIGLLSQVVRGLELPISAGLGTAMLRPSRPASDLGQMIDADRRHIQNWGWPLEDIEQWAQPVPIAGAQGIWPWPLEISAPLRLAAE